MSDEAARLTGAVAGCAALLGPNAHAFMSRVYANGLDRYRRRLVAVGLQGRRQVLDAGCGLGQWSLALADSCGAVTGIDAAPERVAACRSMSRSLGRGNCGFLAAALEQLPFPSGFFDGAISYSVLYFTDYRRAIAEIGRVMRPGGLFYLSTNALGRYIYEIVMNPNPAADFSPRRHAICSVLNTLSGRRRGLSMRSGTAAMSKRGTVAALRAADFEILAVGPEGSLGAGDHPFQPSRYAGLTAVFDVLARRI